MRQCKSTRHWVRACSKAPTKPVSSRSYVSADLPSKPRFICPSITKASESTLRFELICWSRMKSSIELKSIANVLGMHEAQLLSHLRFSNRRLDLLINFNVARLKDGIKRLVNHL